VAIEIEAPDGSIVEFPDGTPDATIEKAMQETYGKKTSGLGAAAAGVGQGLLFGLGDEAAAGAGAAYDYFTGQGDFSSSYDKRLKGQRDYLKAAAKENPGWYYSGLIGSAVALPMSGPGRLAGLGAQRLGAAGLRRLGVAGSTPASLSGRMAGGAIEGAAYGAATGLGQSEGGPQARIEGAVGGGLTGGALGGAAPAVIQGVTSGARAGLNRIQDITRPQAAATRDVARALQNADQIPQATQDVMTGGLADDVLVNLDSSARARALGRRAANLSPEARQTLDDVVNPRLEAQSQRGASLLMRQNQKLTGSAEDIRQSLREQARNANRPAYERAFAQGDRPLNSPTLERLQSSPEFVAAMKEAVPEYQNRAVIDGYQGFNAGVQVTDDGRIVFTRKPGGPPAYPNLAFWDTVKRKLDDAAQRNLRSQGNQGSAGQLAKQLRDELDTMVGSYKATRSQAAKFFGAEDAATAGENFAKGGVRANWREAAKQLKKMTQEEQKVFRDAYANELLRKVEGVKDRADISKKFAQSAKDRAELAIGMGPKKAKEFEAWLHLESIAQKAVTELQGNSTTARQLMEMGGVGVGSGVIFGGGDPTTWRFWQSALIGGAGAYGAQRLNATVAERWAKQVADLLSKKSNPKAFERAMQRLSSNDQLVNRLRDIASRITVREAGVAGGAVGAQEGVADAP